MLIPVEFGRAGRRPLDHLIDSREALSPRLIPGCRHPFAPSSARAGPGRRIGLRGASATPKGRHLANITFAHARDHAVVLLVGELDWEAAHTLVTTLETVIDRYFYRRVELVIASPGGLTQALEYYLGAVHEWRRQQVHFRTRVISCAASAAAVMVSLGDDRVAEPGARLLYHHARAFTRAEITASVTAEIQAALHAVDQRLIGRLCDRVLAGASDSKIPYKAERSDREVLERLYAALREGHETKPRERRRLARAIGHAVERAANEADRETLARIYRRLFEVETPISAPLARTYAMTLGFITRRLNLPNTADAIVRGAAVTATVMIILLFIFVMTRAMVLEQIPKEIALWLTSLTDNKLVLLRLINVILLAIGMVVDDASESILAAIVLLAAATEIGIHPTHFAAIVGVNIAAGNITPPCDPLLYLAGAVGKATLPEMLGPTFKFLLAGYLPVILLVTCVPELAPLLPGRLLGIG